LRRIGEAIKFFVVKPIINLDDPVGKTVGRRLTPRVFETACDTAAAKKAWHQAGFGVRVPRGVYRFHSHEEADEWMMRMLTRPKN